MKVSAVGLIVSLSLLPFTEAAISLPRIFRSGMVLQREMPAPVWGSADVGETVTVRFAEQKKKTVADSEGKWQVTLDPLAASRQPRDFVVSGTNTLTLTDVLVGEVWLCAGQSNMEMPVAIGTKPNAPVAAKTDAQLAADVKNADGFPGLRLFRAEKKIDPLDVVSDGWTDCQGDALARFSAIGYIFARQLQRELSVPIGMIQTAWGGTRVEVWTPPEGYTRLPAFAKEAAAAPLKIDGVVPGKNYAGLVQPLEPFAIRGVLWYQGESNLIEVNDGLRYADKFEALVTSWRSAWGRPNLPFFAVQVAPFKYSERGKDPVKHAPTQLPELWEAQALAAKIPGIDLVPITDLVENVRELHPQRKRPVGERLAHMVLAKEYGRPLEAGFEGPTFEKAELRGDALAVSFSHVGTGLKSRDGKPLVLFEIAGADGKFVPAEATVEGPDVAVISSPEVPQPKAVRFAWTETANPNLVNSAGWPAYPFRTNGPTWQPHAGR